MAAGLVADSLIDPGGTYSRLASYVVGYETNAPRQPHHRGASGVGWEGVQNGLPNAHVLYGALVGGPGSANEFAPVDRCSDYMRNQVAIDYNAGFSGALAYLLQQGLG